MGTDAIGVQLGQNGEEARNEQNGIPPLMLLYLLNITSMFYVYFAYCVWRLLFLQPTCVFSDKFWCQLQKVGSA